MPFATHEEYLANCTVESCALLLRIWQEVEGQVPGASRCIAYQMPAFKMRRVFLYFAAFKNHIGIYPPVVEDEALISETAKFRGPNGNISFRYTRGVQIELIGRVARALSVQYSTRAAKSGLSDAA